MNTFDRPSVAMAFLVHQYYIQNSLPLSVKRIANERTNERTKQDVCVVITTTQEQQ